MMPVFAARKRSNRFETVNPRDADPSYNNSSPITSGLLVRVAVAE
jgi:hypothetical protein